ncbi:hypothetical protein K2P47_03355 [Patescibacteria group bacterium]|nr:hypothetical protein [Patescibacteria group bacterium]
MSPKQLLKKIKNLDTKSSITNKFVSELASIGMWNYEKEAKKTYGGTDQKKHWVGWLSEYSGPGYYNRKDTGVSMAKRVYNRINCPPMLIWLAEASGIQSKQIKQATLAALDAKKSFPSQCSAIRQTIPWEVIEAKLQE